MRKATQITTTLNDDNLILRFRGNPVPVVAEPQNAIEQVNADLWESFNYDFAADADRIGRGRENLEALLILQEREILGHNAHMRLDNAALDATNQRRVNAIEDITEINNNMANAVEESIALNNNGTNLVREGENIATAIENIDINLAEAHADRVVRINRFNRLNNDIAEEINALPEGLAEYLKNSITEGFAWGRWVLIVVASAGISAVASYIIVKVVLKYFREQTDLAMNENIVTAVGTLGGAIIIGSIVGPKVDDFVTIEAAPKTKNNKKEDN